MKCIIVVIFLLSSFGALAGSELNGVWEGSGIVTQGNDGAASCETKISISMTNRDLVLGSEGIICEDRNGNVVLIFLGREQKFRIRKNGEIWKKNYFRAGEILEDGFYLGDSPEEIDEKYIMKNENEIELYHGHWSTGIKVKFNLVRQQE